MGTWGAQGIAGVRSAGPQSRGSGVRGGQGWVRGRQCAHAVAQMRCQGPLALGAVEARQELARVMRNGGAALLHPIPAQPPAGSSPQNQLC